jgi:tRNA(fMet)-specific endonuclease VapC
VADRVLDTDVASFLFKGHSLAARYRPHLRGYTPVVSFMTVAEMYEWALRSRWGPARMARLDATLHTYAVRMKP